MSVAQRMQCWSREQILVLGAFLEGRTGLLDDAGNVIEAESMADNNYFDPEDEDFIHDPAMAVPSLSAVSKSEHFSFPRLMLTIIATCIPIAWLIWMIWLVSRWVGKSVFGVSGAIGNVAGLVAITGAIAFLMLVSSRLTNAKRHRRACTGTRNVADRRHIFFALTQHACCPACIFPIEKADELRNNPYKCSECGATWIISDWNDYLNLDRQGSLHSLTERSQRRACCLFDARDQLFRVMLDLDEIQLSKELRSLDPGSMWMKRSKLVLILSLIISVCLIISTTTITSTSTAVWLILPTISVSALLIVALIVARSHRREIRVQRLRCLARTLIDRGCCASCTNPLDDLPHPVDQCGYCSACGLGFDLDTNNRRHHTRRHVPDDRIRSDPVFE